MSEENVDTFWRALDAFNRGDLDVSLDLIHDGGRADPSFSVDLDGLRAVFAWVSAFGWDAHGAGPDNDAAGPCVSVEGEYNGRAVWLRLLAHAPADVGPALKVAAHNRP